MDIRNKRIVQLESQVGHASDLLADRNTSNELPEVRLKALADKVDGILVKLERLQTSQPLNNIVINSCNPDQSHQRQSNFTQTEADYTEVVEGSDPNTEQLSCNTCGKICTSNVVLQKHITDDHGNQPHSEMPSL